MKRIICSVMDEKVVKEYELTYDEATMNEFMSTLENRTIAPVQSYDNMMRIHESISIAEKYDMLNKLLTFDDIKNYIKSLHESNSMDLSQLYYLMNSNNELRNNQIRELFREFLDIYTYKEIVSYDAYYMSAITRKMHELDYENTTVDHCVININTQALDSVGFSIESKIREQEHQKVIKR